jgi:hypothetical protein
VAAPGCRLRHDVGEPASWRGASGPTIEVESGDGPLVCAISELTLNVGEVSRSRPAPDRMVVDMSSETRH